MRSFGVLACALTLTILLAAEAAGQSGAATVAVNGQVSEAVFVSITPGAQLSADNLQVTYSNPNTHSVLLSINTSGNAAGRISIPLQLRSNVPFTLSADANMRGTTLRALCVKGARATGRLVAAEASTVVNAASCDGTTAIVQTPDAKRGALPFSSPFSSQSALLNGPRISLGGTLETPFNALEVTVLIEVSPQDGQAQGRFELLLSASPASRISTVINDVRQR